MLLLWEGVRNRKRELVRANRNVSYKSIHFRKRLDWNLIGFFWVRYHRQQGYNSVFPCCCSEKKRHPLILLRPQHPKPKNREGKWKSRVVVYVFICRKPQNTESITKARDRKKKTADFLLQLGLRSSADLTQTSMDLVTKLKTRTSPNSPEQK